jgi:uncharacterized membrane protein
MTDAHILQLCGIFFLSFGLGTLLQPHTIKKMLEEMQQSSALTFLGALLALIGGFLLVTFHNTWTGLWPTVVTIIGWITMLKGISLLVFPSSFLSGVHGLMKHQRSTTIWSIVALIIGVVLTYVGYAVI